MSWKNLRENIPNKSYFSNVDCLDGKFVRSSLLKAYFGVPSLAQLYLFCHAFVAKQLDKYISFCSISKNLTHFKTKLVRDDCNKTQQNTTKLYGLGTFQPERTRNSCKYFLGVVVGRTLQAPYSANQTQTLNLSWLAHVRVPALGLVCL